MHGAHRKSAFLDFKLLFLALAIWAVINWDAVFDAWRPDRDEHPTVVHSDQNERLLLQPDPGRSEVTVSNSFCRSW